MTREWPPLNYYPYIPYSHKAVRAPNKRTRSASATSDVHGMHAQDELLPMPPPLLPPPKPAGRKPRGGARRAAAATHADLLPTQDGEMEGTLPVSAFIRLVSNDVMQHLLFVNLTDGKAAPPLHPNAPCPLQTPWPHPLLQHQFHHTPTPLLRHNSLPHGVFLIIFYTLPTPCPPRPPCHSHFQEQVPTASLSQNVVFAFDGLQNVPASAT